MMAAACAVVMSTAAAPSSFGATRLRTEYAASPTKAQSGFGATRLRTEYADSPVNVDERIPRFSWALSHPTRGATQRSWRVVVANSTATLWDSGVITSSQTLNVEYGCCGGTALPLAPDRDYGWTVRWVDASGAASEAANATFSTALFSEADWRGSQWVAAGGSGNTLRATFSLPAAGRPTRARLYIATLGAHAATLNGASADTHRLSAYTVFTRRAGYFVSDVAALLRPGCNVLALTLGSGRFGKVFPASAVASRILLSVDDQYWVALGGTGTPHSAGTRASAKFLLQSNSLVFNATAGPVSHDDEFDGETFDARVAARLGQFDSSCAYVPAPGVVWAPAIAVTPNATEGPLLLTAVRAPVRADPDWTPTVASVVAREGGAVYVADTGAGTAGYCALAFPAGCPAGTVVTLTYGEQLLPNGTVTDNRRMVDTYVCGGGGSGVETFRGAKFAYFGYRWIAVRGHPSPAGPAIADFACVSLHAALPPAGTFSTGGALPQLDAILAMSRASILANTQSTPTDDPNRSRQGWVSEVGRGGLALVNDGVAAGRDG